MISEQNVYTQKFFEVLQEGSRHSAREIIPLLLEFIQPESVVDVGCGDGTWLSVFREFGIQDYLGIDGDYVDRSLLKIPEETFMPSDLNLPLQVNRKFDLVVSLEVAEHLSNNSAKLFIDSLTQLGNIILFSAAIPFQGGVDHINEQWIDYWETLFNEKGYVAIDCLRKRIWDNENVEFWYAQNMIVFVEKNHLEGNHLLRQELAKTEKNPLALVHPRKYVELHDKYLALIEKHAKAVKAVEWYEAAVEPKNMSLKKLLLALPTVTKNTLVRKLRQSLQKKFKPGFN